MSGVNFFLAINSNLTLNIFITFAGYTFVYKLISSVVCGLLVACHHIYDKKSLSNNVTEDQITKLTKAEDDVKQPVKSGKKHVNSVVIPTIFKQKISLTVNETINIKDVLYETALKLGINIHLDPNINVTVIYSAKDKPFIEILDEICDMTDMRYTIHNNTLSIVKDTPFTVIYQTQFLNLTRSSTNTVSTNSDLSSEVIVQNRNANNTAQKDAMYDSNNSITTTASNCFLEDLQNGLSVILGKDCTYSINKQSGTIAICANAKTHSYVREYLNAIKLATESQVLIETKIIEVSLKKQYQHGIKWEELTQGRGIDHKVRVLSGDAGAFDIKYAANNIHYLTNFLEQFGVARTVSNPRVTVMNNQPAILKVAKNHVYFKINHDRSVFLRDADREWSSTSSDIKTIPIGLILFVQPSIDVENGTVTLFLRPTISKLQENIADPAVDIALNAQSENKRSFVPVTSVREISSVLKLKDGEVAVLGGFMEIDTEKHSAGLPIFRSVMDSRHLNKDNVVELVILIKVNIVGVEHHTSKADLRLARFVPDPRPFF